MGETEDFLSSRRQISERFLQTAVVIDDEAYMTSDQNGVPTEDIVPPSRKSRDMQRVESTPIVRKKPNRLDAKTITESFTMVGVICGVVGPTTSQNDTSQIDMMRQADIVVLDWLLRDRKPALTLALLHNLLFAEGDRNSLRLVAIYTGDGRLGDISDSVQTKLNELGLDPKPDESKTTISYRHGRIVLYAKSSVNLAPEFEGRSIEEVNLPESLIDDFSDMTEGLLPSIALTSLTAAREGAHRILDQFCADLDPAFLAHRVCLSNPDDAEQQIVNHVAQELRGLMESAVVAESPAGAKAVEDWIRGKGSAPFRFGDRELDIEETIMLAKDGLQASQSLKNKAFEGLSAGFAGASVADLDERLAWIMSFRTVFDAPPPTLWLGSVVTMDTDDGNRQLICMRPRCDCIRLKQDASFLFLPLLEPSKGNEQLVVKDGAKFERLGVELDSAHWVRRRFNPSNGNHAVTASKTSSGAFVFTDTCKKQYTWKGELKTEYAQRIMQTFTTKLNRIAVDESEWLRRMVRRG